MCNNGASCFVLFTRYYEDQIKGHAGWRRVYSMHDGGGKHKILVGKPAWKRLLGKPRHR
jgi:hypothetical protein